MFFKTEASPLVLQTVRISEGKEIEKVELLSDDKALLSTYVREHDQRHGEIWDLAKNKCIKRFDSSLPSSFLELRTVSYSKNKLFEFGPDFDNDPCRTSLAIYNMSTNKLENTVLLDSKFPNIRTKRDYYTGHRCWLKLFLLHEHEMFCVVNNDSVSFWDMNGKYLVSGNIPLDKSKIPFQVEELEDSNTLAVLSNTKQTFYVNKIDLNIHIRINKNSLILNREGLLQHVKSLPNSPFLMTHKECFIIPSQIQVFNSTDDKLLFTH